MHLPQVRTPHHHLIYFHWGETKKKENDFGYKRVSCLQDQIYESFIHDPFEWMSMEINKLDGWMDG
jgi:hypothetical protein